MSNLPKADIQEDLMALTKAPRRGSKAESPMKYLKTSCPTLLGLMRTALSSIGIKYVDVEGFTEALLEEVAFKSEAAKVQQAGDLLGLTPENIDTRQIFDDYNKSRSDAPKKYFRFNRQVRQIIAAHRDGFSYTITRNAQDETDWMEEFVNELCTYLDNEDGKLVTFAHKSGYLSADEIDASAALASSAKTQHSDKSTELLVSPTGYVHRTQMEERFRTLVERGAKIIAFVGFAGMGKTTAAKALTAKYSSNPPAPLIRFIDGQIFTNDVQAALQRHGIAAPRTTSENVQENFIRLVSAEEAPDFVILDNFEDLDQVAALLPYYTESRIVATCRLEGEPASSKFNIIDVKKMTISEARAMTIELIPGLSNADASDIAEVLDGYPLAISHACGLVIAIRTSVVDLCRELSRKPSKITEENKAQNTLHEILSRIVSALHNENPFALELLTLISLPSRFLPKSQLRMYPRGLAFMHRAKDPRYFGRVEYVLRMYVAARFGYSNTELEYARALNTLRRYRLIDIEQISHKPTTEGLSTIVNVHSLAGAILLRLLDDYISMVRDTMASAIQLHWQLVDWRSPATPFNSYKVLALKYGYLFDAYDQAAHSNTDTLRKKVKFNRQLKRIDRSYSEFYHHLTKRAAQLIGPTAREQPDWLSLEAP